MAYVFRLFVFNLCFFSFNFSSFSYLFLAVVDLLLRLLSIQEFLRKHHRDGRFVLWSSQVLLRKLCSELITLFVALREYLWLSGPTHSDLGITGKIFSSCRLKKIGYK